MRFSQDSKYPPAEPGALGLEPLEAAGPCCINPHSYSHFGMPPQEPSARLVCAASPCPSNSLRSLAAMSWQRPNIGSRMNREVHVRVWERAEVKFLRATRQKPALPRCNSNGWFTSISRHSGVEMPCS